MAKKARDNASIVDYALRGYDAETKTGAFSTENTAGRHLWLSHSAQSKAWKEFLYKASDDGHISQVIYSYWTPIAWLDARYGWIVPTDRYSTTTSTRHQTHLHRLRGRYVSVPWDATAEDIQRVLDGHMVFTTNSRGDFTGIRAA